MNHPSPARSLLFASCLFLASCTSSAEERIVCGPEAQELPREFNGQILDLGEECKVAGFLAVNENRAYVTCGGTWGSDEGRLVLIDLADLTVVRSTHLGGMAGPLVVTGGRVWIGDGTEGRLFVTNLDGDPIHDESDPVMLCPSDLDAGLLQFISGLEATPSGDILATCFGSSEVIRFRHEPGATDGPVHNARVMERATAGHGASGVTLAGDEAAVVIDALAGTLTRLTLEPEMVAEVGLFDLGDAPNEIAVHTGFGYVTNSMSHTLQVLDLAADPSAATKQEVFLGDSTNPGGLALLADGVALVTLLMANQVAVVDTITGEISACVELPSDSDLLPFDGMSPLARPQSVAVTEAGTVLVTLNNMDAAWAPAGHGLVVVLALD